MTEPVDEYLMEVFKEYDEYKFICIGKGVIYLNYTDDEQNEYDKVSEEYKELCDYIKSLYNNLLTVKISLYLNQLPSSDFLLYMMKIMERERTMRRISIYVKTEVENKGRPIDKTLKNISFFPVAMKSAIDQNINES